MSLQSLWSKRGMINSGWVSLKFSSLPVKISLQAWRTCKVKWTRLRRGLTWKNLPPSKTFLTSLRGGSKNNSFTLTFSNSKIRQPPRGPKSSPKKLIPLLKRASPLRTPNRASRTRWWDLNLTIKEAMLLWECPAKKFTCLGSSKMTQSNAGHDFLFCGTSRRIRRCFSISSQRSTPKIF